MGEDEGERRRDPIEEGFEIPVFEPAATPRERLRQMFQKNDLGIRSFELQKTRDIALIAFATGAVVGILKVAPAAEQTWKQTHYHSLFMNDKDAGRYFMNYAARRFIFDGGRYGLRVGVVSGLLALSAGCLAARRNEARVTDVGISGAFASFLYRIDVGPRAMLATSIIGGAYWQLCALALLPGLRLAGYTWDGFYKEYRKTYYEEENGRARFMQQVMEIDTQESHWPWQLKRRWAEHKLEEEQRLAELRSSSKYKPVSPIEPTPTTPNKKADAAAVQEKE